MTHTNDRLDEVIHVEAVADWSRAESRAASACAGAAREAGNRWDQLTDDARLHAAVSASSASAPTKEAIGRLQHAVSLATWIGIAAAAVLGALAVAASLPTNRVAPTNIFWLLAGVLGIQTVLLLLWVFLALFASRERTGGLAAWTVARLARLVATRAAGTEEHANRAGTISSASAMSLVIRRRSRLEARTPLARWGLGVVTNSMWTAFNLAGLAAALVLLGSRQYEFAWESTILGPDRYVAAIDTVAWLPRQLGFTAPDAAAIAASRFDPTSPDAFPTQSDELRAAWSGLLIGAIVAYGLLPRLLLTGLCLARRRAARRAAAVDVADPAVAALLEAARTTTAPSTPPPDAQLPSASPLDRSSEAAGRPVGTAAIVGLEIEPPAGGWPPALDRELDDLGLVSSGEDRRRVERNLATSTRRPISMVVVCAASATPDRGVGATIRGLAAAAGSPLLLVVSGGDRLRSRESRATTLQRLEDWKALAAGLGAFFVEVDLDHLTADSRRRLGDAIGSAAATERGVVEDAGAPPPIADDLAPALRTIVAASRGWHDETGSPRLPTTAEEADLHRRIVRIFEGDGELARWPFPPLSPGDPAGSIRRAASRIESMLPASLRLRPKWLAAGAAAGALGCIAAATLISPLAISALPVWAAIGGSVTGLLSARSPATTASAAGHDHDARIDLGPAVATAVLQAVLLAHQGRGEAAIGDALGAAVEADEPPHLPDADAVAAWCRTVEARLAAFDRGDSR